MVTTCTKQLPFEARSYWSHACCDCFWKLRKPSLTSERKHDGHGQHALLWVLKIMLLCSVYFWNHTAQGGLTDQAPCSVCGRNFNPDVLVSKQRLKSSNLIHPSVCSFFLVMNKLVRRSLKRGKFLTRQSRDIVAQNWSTFCPPTNRLLLSSPRRTREAGEKSTQSLYSLSEQQEMCL